MISPMCILLPHGANRLHQSETLSVAKTFSGLIVNGYFPRLWTVTIKMVNNNLMHTETVDFVHFLREQAS